MAAIWFYVKTRIRRGLWQSLSIITLIALLCSFSASLEGFIRQKEEELDSAYDTIAVTVVVSNLTGTQTDNIEIADYIVNYFLSDRYVYGGKVQPRAFSSYLKDVRCKASVYYCLRSGFKKGKRLSGITNVDAATELSEPADGNVTYFPGYDRTLFASSNWVCIIPEKVREELTPDAGGNLSLTVQMSPHGASGAVQTVDLKVVGVHTADSETVYCPWACIAAIQTELDGKLTADSLSATVRDNRELEEFRQLLLRHFAEVDPSGHHREINDSPALRYHLFAITVHDELLRETLNSLHRNLQTLYRLRPIFIVLEALIGFIAGFFSMHTRRREFAIARSLGTTLQETIGIALLETMLQCILGVGVGVGITALLTPIRIRSWFLALLPAAIVTGAIAACIQAVKRKEIQILREVG